MGNISSKLEANSIILQTAGKGLQPKVNVHFPWYLICFSQHNLCYLPNPTSKNKTGRKVTVRKKKKNGRMITKEKQISQHLPKAVFISCFLSPVCFKTLLLWNYKCAPYYVHNSL